DWTTIMTRSPVAERTLIDQFLDSLRELPDVQVESNGAEFASAAGAPFDFVIHLIVAGKPVVLVGEAKKTVYPRDVRQVLWQLKSTHQRPHADAQPLLIAESLSPGAKELLRNERIGYYDG